MKLTTHLQPGPRLRMIGAIPHIPICLHGVEKQLCIFYLYCLKLSCSNNKKGQNYGGDANTNGNGPSC
jgi:hypothetical protein